MKEEINKVLFKLIREQQLTLEEAELLQRYTANESRYALRKVIPVRVTLDTFKILKKNIRGNISTYIRDLLSDHIKKQGW